MLVCQKKTHQENVYYVVCVVLGKGAQGTMKRKIKRYKELIVWKIAFPSISSQLWELSTAISIPVEF